MVCDTVFKQKMKLARKNDIKTAYILVFIEFTDNKESN